MSLEDDILIERFLKGQLSNQELIEFKHRLGSDVDFEEQVTLERQLFETLDEEYWSVVRKNDSSKLSEDKRLIPGNQVKAISEAIAQANNKYQNRGKSKSLKRWFLYPVAATIIFFAAFYLLSPSSKSAQELYLSYLEKSEAYSHGIRGDGNVKQELTEAYLYFENEEYLKAEALFSEVLAGGYQDGSLYINLAISQMRLELFTKAGSTLDQLIQSDIIDREKGYWYKTLLYLRADDADKAISTLNLIVENTYFNAELAKELLEELK